MRLVSQIFQPIITVPRNAKIKNTEVTCKSQKLLLECGLVRPTSSGLFAILPLARRALDKLETIIRTHLEDAGVQRMSLPSLTSSKLWQRSGRLDENNDLLKVKDRHDKEYVLAPTHEEAVADLLADVSPFTYKQLPLLLYQITNKYRDEFRPKHGLLRAREFTMLDAYGAHVNEECAVKCYDRMAGVYETIFKRLQLPVYKVRAPSGDMGGTLSHEWQLCANAGEDSLNICPSCSHASLQVNEGARCEQCGKEMERFNSIEVGHTFLLGTRYSEPLGAKFTPSSGAGEPIYMSCYGIGITRLLAAGLEALSTEKAIKWPKDVAPFDVIIIGPKQGSKEWEKHGVDSITGLYKKLRSPEFDVIVDDRHSLTIGKRLVMAQKMGYPTIIVCGKSILDPTPKYEVHRADEVQMMTADELVKSFNQRVDCEDEFCR